MVYESELYHHGILGMKWGVRRYQNKDGSLTAEGKKHLDAYKGVLRAKNNHKRIEFRALEDGMYDPYGKKEFKARNIYEETIANAKNSKSYYKGKKIYG